jgi:hypothetical protein
MGRRSRKRGVVAGRPREAGASRGRAAASRGEAAAPGAAASPGATAPARPSRRTPRERPKAPWHPVPLAEIATLAGIVLLVIGFFDYQERKWLLVAGMALASLGGLDTAAREHFAGFGSHTTVLAALPAVILAAALYFASAPWLVLVVLVVAVFAASFWLLRRAWRPRASL